MVGRSRVRLERTVRGRSSTGRAASSTRSGGTTSSSTARVGSVAVLQTVGVGGAPDDALRLYRLGPYGALVGADAYALAVPGPPVAAATLAAPLRYQTVDTDAEDVPWASIQGDIAIGVGRSVAVSANGVIAGVFTTVGPPHGGRTSYYGMLAPVLRDGTNLMQLFLIDGPPDQPVLRPVTIEAASPGK